VFFEVTLHAGDVVVVGEFVGDGGDLDAGVDLGDRFGGRCGLGDQFAGDVLDLFCGQLSAQDGEQRVVVAFGDSLWIPGTKPVDDPPHQRSIGHE
jgi:hypothetical protein